MLIGKLPTQANINDVIQKAKEIGKDQLEQVEKTASKILAQVDKAKKEGKGGVDALIAGLNACKFSP